MIAMNLNEGPQSHTGQEPGALGARRAAASPSHERHSSHGRHLSVPALLGASALLLCLAGCAARNELAEARLDADECRLELRALRAKLHKQEDKSLVRAQRDRLAAENEHLERELAAIRERERQLRSNLAVEAQAGPKARDQTAAQRKELERALANIRRIRRQWEQTLAQHQRQIDVLTSQIERLRKELEAARALARAATQPQ